jgi:phosphotransferase system enzyme I (PtsP)
MLEKLRQIVMCVAEAPDLTAALSQVVKGVRSAVSADACGAYLVDPADDHLVLMEVDGFDRDAIGRVRLAPGEGVAGLIRQRREPVSLDDAEAHPRFRRFPEIDEVRLRGFLGVPILHRRRVLGVLVVGRRSRRLFGTRQEAFLVTASAQIAGALAEVLALSHGKLPLLKGPVGGYIQGVVGAPGVAIGLVVAPSPLAAFDSVDDSPAADVAIEEAAFREAVTAVQASLLASGERMRELLPSEDYALFEVYGMLVGDESLTTQVVQHIRTGARAAAALRHTIKELAAAFEGMVDERLRVRAEDVRAIGRRLLLALQTDIRKPHDFPSRSILVGDEVSLARIADVPREQLAGVLCLKGSALSHTAVIARSLGVPAVMGLGDLSIDQLAGKRVVIDGYVGRVFVEPTPAVLAEFEHLEREEEMLSAELEALRTLPSETLDGARLPLYVNTGLLTDIEPSLKVEPAGVGLYRSEFPFMLRETFPSESEQAETYRRILEAFAPRPVVMRTLDIGGDKPLAYFPIKESNSLLGWRGIRVTLEHPEIFLAQIKAMLLANVGLDNLRLLLPMVSLSSQIHEAQQLLDQAIKSLSVERKSIRRPPLGIMLEVPVVLFSLEKLAEHVDFFSLGTNDLTQYLMAVDRSNSQVADIYDHLDPGVLRAVHYAVTRAREIGKPISLCGELAADPAGAILLTAMNVDYLSVSAAALPRVKWAMRSITREQAEELLATALDQPDGAAVRRLIHSALEEKGLGGLVRAGR